METLVWLTNLKHSEPQGWHLVIEDRAGKLIRLQPLSHQLAVYLHLAGVPEKEYGAPNL